MFAANVEPLKIIAYHMRRERKHEAIPFMRGGIFNIKPIVQTI